MKKWLRLMLILIAALLAVYFGVGGGYGTKANSSRLHSIELAHFAHRAGDDR